MRYDHYISFVRRSFLLLALSSALKIVWAQGIHAPVKAVASIVSEQGLTLLHGTYGNSINGQSFQQDALTSYAGWQYVTFYDSARHVCVGRRKLPAGNWAVISLNDHHFSSVRSQENDAHNTISMGLCPANGTIHLSFDQHGGGLNYRVSDTGLLAHPEKVKWTAKEFGPVSNALQAGKRIPAVSYPVFITTPMGGLLFCYRNGYSGNGDCLISQYNGASKQWDEPHIFLSGQATYTDPYGGASKARNAYLNNLSYDKKDRLHTSWTWRDIIGPEGNHDICYAYSDDNGNNWFNGSGLLIASKDRNLPIDINTPGITVKNLDRGWGMINQQAQATDSDLIPHILMSHRRVKGQPGWSEMADGAYFHYYKGNTSWVENRLPFVGNRPKLITDHQNNLYLVYIAKGNFDFIDQGAPLIVAKATAKKRWLDWKIVYRSTSVYFNEVQSDLPRWKSEHILSVFVQDVAKAEGAPSAIRIIDISGL